MSEFSNKLIFLRKEKGLTMVKLSEQSGLSQSYISQLENEKKYPTTEAINTISKGLAINKGVLDIQEQEKIKKELSEAKNNDDLSEAIGNVDSLISFTKFSNLKDDKDALKQIFVNEVNKRLDEKFIELSPIIEENEKQQVFTLYGEPLSSKELWFLKNTLLGIRESRNNI